MVTTSNNNSVEFALNASRKVQVIITAVFSVFQKREALKPSILNQKFIKIQNNEKRTILQVENSIWCDSGNDLPQPVVLLQ